MREINQLHYREREKERGREEGRGRDRARKASVKGNRVMQNARVKRIARTLPRAPSNPLRAHLPGGWVQLIRDYTRQVVGRREPEKRERTRATRSVRVRARETEEAATSRSRPFSTPFRRIYYVHPAATSTRREQGHTCQSPASLRTSRDKRARRIIMRDASSRRITPRYFLFNPSVLIAAAPLRRFSEISANLDNVILA